MTATVCSTYRPKLPAERIHGLSTIRIQFLANFAIVISIALYLASLSFPCYSYGQEGSVFGETSLGSVYGFNLLLIGWMGVFSLEFAWFANPLYFCTCAAIAASRKTALDEGQATLLSLMPCFAIAFALSFLFHTTTAAGGGPIGTGWVITAYLPGYYLWVASMVVLLFALPTKKCDDVDEEESEP